MLLIFETGVGPSPAKMVAIRKIATAAVAVTSTATTTTNDTNADTGTAPPQTSVTACVTLRRSSRLAGSALPRNPAPAISNKRRAPKRKPQNTLGLEPSEPTAPTATTAQIIETFPRLSGMFLDQSVEGADVEPEIAFVGGDIFSYAAGRQRELAEARKAPPPKKRKSGPKRKRPDDNDDANEGRDVVRDNPRKRSCRSRYRPGNRYPIAAGPPAGTAARIQYLMDEHRWPEQINGDNARIHLWDHQYELRVATHCPASRLPAPPQTTTGPPTSATKATLTANPEADAGEPRTQREQGWVHRHTVQIKSLRDGVVKDIKMSSRDQQGERGGTLRSWRIRSNGESAVPTAMGLPKQGEKRKRSPTAEERVMAAPTESEPAASQRGRSKRRRQG
ncbi:hypothetical protein TWF481_004973 [Arthrobotrys musiformis]|uniref:Rrn9 domain-containing protein n=1 Tax=Arthrobotrys musiformis TaxID=47236 RepID=A0AAV9WM08_9PEZI